MREIIREIIELIPSFNHEERYSISQRLNSIDNSRRVIDLIENRIESNYKCPHCGHEKIYKHGKVSGLQRYRCQSCGRTFNALSKTKLAHMRKKELWLPYIEEMLESKVLRKIVKKIDINLKTAFSWRHKFSQLLNNDRSHILTGIVEADETYFRISHKGSKKMLRKPHKRGGDNAKRGLSKEKVCVLVAGDRYRHYIEFIAGYGAVKGEWLDKHLNKYIAQDSILVTDGLRSYTHFTNKYHILHKIVRNYEGMRVVGSYHIQNVNAYHHRLRDWIIATFHGVATKYLSHYLRWRHALENRLITNSTSLFKVMIR